MNAAAALVIAGFLALWIVPSLWTAKRVRGLAAPDTAAWQRSGALLAAYSLLFFGAAWWWHTPLTEQNSLRAFAREPALVPIRVDCTQVQAAIASATELSGGRFAISAEGSVTIDGDLWRALRPAQREGVQALAAQVAECSDDGGQPRIEDAATGAILTTE